LITYLRRRKLPTKANPLQEELTISSIRKTKKGEGRRKLKPSFLPDKSNKSSNFLSQKSKH
jgi:hypothetical protein